MSRRSLSVNRSNSYLNVLKPFLNDQYGSNYATCPAISLYQKHKLLEEAESNSLSTAASLASLLHSEWQKKRSKKVKCTVDKQLSLWQEPAGCYNKMIMQRSLPVFEVLPPLVTDIFRSCVNKTVSKQGYTRFFKCIKKKCKPTDSDIIFGDSSNMCTKCSWERSRIDWLAEIEGHIQIKSGKRRLVQIESDDDLHDICCFPFVLKPRTFYQYTGIESNV